jgi:starch synthase
MVGSEAVPFAKTGGLADVLGALPLALGRLGWQVTVVLPQYRGAERGPVRARMALTVGGVTSEVGLIEVPLAVGVHAVLVDEPSLFDREGLYGVGNADYPDNPRRFAVLARAALEYAGSAPVPPSLVHAHDWQAGLVPVYLRTRYRDHPTLGGIGAVFTIHNLSYQGLFAADWLPRLDLPWDLLSMDRLEYWGRISFLKGGLVDSDVITTVSPRYAHEIQTPEGGVGFDGILRGRAADLVGILNGIDTDAWDPRRDPHLPAPFGPDDLSGKRAAKQAVLARYGIPTDAPTMARPLIAMISRMVDQKGFDLVAALEPELPRLDASFVVLGTGEARYQDHWRRLAARRPDRIGAEIGFDEGLAHLIEAGADAFLMPSRFEPCGLNQMYSLRYGTVPIVRAVGGLADTVRDPASPGGPPTGFVFEAPTPEALLDALRRALAAYADPPRWRAMQVAGMTEDHSWDRSAREYVTIYGRAVQTAKPRRSDTRRGRNRAVSRSKE